MAVTASLEEPICYDSWRNRHCPKCQGRARAKWLAAEPALLLPIPYFHVVFTLPHRLNPLIRVHQRVLYTLLFRTAAQTLQEFARVPKHLGAEMGITAVLHTWGQTLTEHVHVHCVVYAKPPWGSPAQVLKYLSRYTHRVASANSRLVFVGDGVVRFRYTDYAAQGATKSMELQAPEFLRRFLLHVVPPGFVRIRPYGLLANRARQEQLTRARQLLASVAATPLLSPMSWLATVTSPPTTVAVRCPPRAGTHWRLSARLLPQRGLPP